MGVSLSQSGLPTAIEVPTKRVRLGGWSSARRLLTSSAEEVKSSSVRRSVTFRISFSDVLGSRIQRPVSTWPNRSAPWSSPGRKRWWSDVTRHHHDVGHELNDHPLDRRGVRLNVVDARDPGRRKAYRPEDATCRPDPWVVPPCAARRVDPTGAGQTRGAVCSLGL